MVPKIQNEAGHEKTPDLPTRLRYGIVNSY
jgi:hypothetical protein